MRERLSVVYGAWAHASEPGMAAGNTPHTPSDSTPPSDCPRVHVLQQHASAIFYRALASTAGGSKHAKPTWRTVRCSGGRSARDHHFVGMVKLAVEHTAR